MTMRTNLSFFLALIVALIAQIVHLSRGLR